jgi:hypothetical protein
MCPFVLVSSAGEYFVHWNGLDVLGSMLLIVLRHSIKV